MSDTASSPAANGIGVLADLLDSLHRVDRIAIGLDRAQHAAILLRRLDQQGVPLDDPEAAARWLAPVLCVTARDRAVLQRRLRARAGTPAPRFTLPELRGEALERADEQHSTRRWLLVAGLLLLLGLLLGTALLLAGRSGTAPALDPSPATAVAPAPTATGSMLAELLTGAAFMILLPAGFLLLRRRTAVAVPPPDPQPSGQWLDWLDPGALQGPLRLTGTQRRLPGRWLDLPATIARTVRRAGWPTIVRSGALRTPEHLVLVELGTGSDARSLTAFTLLDRLRKADLRVAAFVFIGRPDIVRPLEGGRAEALAQVADRYPDARLILVADGTVFFNAFAAGAVVPPSLARLRLRVLLTPTPRANWSALELAYDRAGWQIAEQSTDGVVELARWLSGPREQPAPLQIEPAAPDLPMLLARDGQLFGERPPGAEARQRLTDELATWLDPDIRRPPDTFEAFRVLAIGAQLRPGTIERVLAHLALLGGPALDEPGIRRLLRLPWLFRGALPLWLRDDLLRGMPATLLDRGRQAWLLHLADRDPADGMPSPDELRRLQREATSRSGDSLQTDTLTRSLLGLATLAARRPTRRDVALLFLLALAGAVLGALLPALGTLTDTACNLALTRAGDPCGQARELLRAVALSPWAMLGAVVLAMISLRAPASLRAALTLPPLAYVLVVALVIAATEAGTILDFRAGVAAVMTMGLLLLRTTLGRIAPMQRTGAVGHPWMNAATLICALATIAADTFTLGGAGQAGSAGVIVATALSALATAALTGTIAWRRVSGSVTWLPVRAAAVYMIAFLPLLALTNAGFLAANVQGNLVPILAGVGPAIGLLAAAGAVVRVRWLRLGLILLAGYGLALFVLAPLLGVYDSPPLLWLILAAVAVGAAPGADLRRFGIYLGIALLAYLAVVLTSKQLAYTPGDRQDWWYAANLIIIGTQWLLLWPAACALRPDLRTPTNGLWWRCLLLLPCVCTLALPVLGTTGTPLLFIPLAAWIAHRHGPQALPAIALAVAPTLLFVRLPPAFNLGGGLGFGLAALLVASFVSVRSFREACLAADRLRAWHLVALGILPLGFSLAGPSGGGLHIGAVFNPWSLVLAVAFLLGLSRVALRPVALVLCGSVGLAFLARLGTSALGVDRAMGPLGATHSMSGMPGDALSVLLALGLGRALVQPGHRLRRLLDLRRRPVRIWLAVAVATAYLGNVSIGRASITPFYPTHALLLVLFWAATDIRPGREVFAIGPLRVPWPVVWVAAIAAIDLLPGLTFSLGPLTLNLFERTPLNALLALLSLWAFHAMGRALPTLLPTTTAASRQPSPVFEAASVRIGIGLAALAVLILLTQAAVIAGDTLQDRATAPPVNQTAPPAKTAS